MEARRASSTAGPDAVVAAEHAAPRGQDRHRRSPWRTCQELAQRQPAASSMSSCSAVGSAVAALAIACTCAVEIEPARARACSCRRPAELLAVSMRLRTERLCRRPARRCGSGDTTTWPCRRRSCARRAATASSSWRPSIRSPRRRAAHVRTRSPSADLDRAEPQRAALLQLRRRPHPRLRTPTPANSASNRSEKPTRGGLRKPVPSL